MYLSVFLVFVFAMGYGGLRVNGHELVVQGGRPIFAREGEDVILNCSLGSPVPSSGIEEVTWKKKDQDILVLLYQENKTFQESSHERYRGRVDLFDAEIPKGNVSLKLKDVQMEDKGEFVCEVHVGNISAHTVVVLQGVGFSAVHIAILVSCSVSLLLAVGFCRPGFLLLRNEDTCSQGIKMHICLILCPNICMFVAFCLWSTEGFLSEVVACSTVSIMRPVMLLKMSPHLARILSERLQKAVKALAVPVYHSTITLAACSNFWGNFAQIQRPVGHSVTVLTIIVVLMFLSAAVLAHYGLRIQLTVCLEILNVALFGLLISSSRDLDVYSDIVQRMCVLAPPAMLMLMVLSLQRHFFQGKPFGCVPAALSSIIVIVYSLGEIIIFLLMFVTLNIFGKIGWMVPVEGVMFISSWFALLCFLYWCQGQRQRCCSEWRKAGHLCCGVVVAFLIAVHGVAYFRYVYVIKDVKDRDGYLALTPLIHLLAALCLFKHPKYLPDVLHRVIYMFGAVGLSAVNAIALAAEQILRAGKGGRTVGDLRVIVLSFETVSVSAWLALQLHDAWTRRRDGIMGDSEDTRATMQVFPEMKRLSAQPS